MILEKWIMILAKLHHFFPQNGNWRAMPLVRHIFQFFFFFFLKMRLFERLYLKIKKVKFFTVL